MDQAEYKTICERADVFSRGTLEQTTRELELAQRHTLTRQLRAIVGRRPIPKPDRHSAGPESDYFKVALSAQDVGEITEVLGCAEADAVSPEGETTPEAARLASLLDAWLPLLQSRSTR